MASREAVASRLPHPAPLPGRSGWTGIGNRAILRTLEGVSRPEDPGEREATQIAARAETWSPSSPSPPPTGLDSGGRTAMIGLLGDAFDDVALHTNTGASRIAESVGARAVTRGRDVYFASGRYQPGTPAGARLLAHELVHTRQAQAGGATLHRDGEVLTRTYLIEASEPEVFLFAGTATREQIAATLYGDPGMVLSIQFVPTAQAKSVDGVVAQGARPKAPGALTAGALASLRWALDTALASDVERTISILSERSIGASDEASLAELTLRWSQRSDVTAPGGTSYFDAYLAALDRRRLSQPHWYTLGIAETTKSALEWLFIEADGSAEQIRKAIELRSTAYKGTTGYTVTDRTPELQTGDIVGRFHGSDGGTTQVRVLETIGHDVAEEPTARLVQRRLVGAASSSGLGTGVVVPAADGGFTGYLVDFALLDAFVPHPFTDEGGHYYWYYPGTRMVAEHQLWDAATRAQFQGDVRSQSADWEADLIGMEAAAVKIRASAAAGILSAPFLKAWETSDRAMIEVSGKLAAKQPIDGAAATAAVRAFFNLARIQVMSLDTWETIDLDPLSDLSSARQSFLSNPYFEAERHADVVKRLDGAATAVDWRKVLTDYHQVTAGMDEFLAKRLRDTGGDKGKEQAARLEYAGAAARQLDALTVDHPTGRRIRATFYPLDALTAEQGGLGPVTAAPMNCLFYTYREGTTWNLVDLTTPRKAKVTDEGGGTDTTPPWKLFTELNTRLRFPRGRLYWEMPAGEIRVMTTTQPTELSDWLKGLGMTLGIMAMAVGTLGAGIPATLLIIGSALSGAAGTAAEMYEKSEAGVLTDTDVLVGVVDIIAGLATAGAATSGHIIRSAALKTGSAARLATSLDTHVYRQLVGVSLFGQALTFVVTTRQILDEYYKAKAAADAAGSDLALRRLLMHIFMSGGMLLMSAKSDIKDITRGSTLRLGTFEGDDIAIPIRPRAEMDAIHDEWVAEMTKLGTRGQPGPRSGPPLEPGLVGKYDDAHTAYRAYDATLKRPGEAEVGVFRNAQGEYVVMIGKATGVDPPTGGGPWHAVVHYHSNPGNSLTMRNPAAADVEGAIQVARDSGRPVTEFVEAPLPGGGRTVTSYTVTPEGRITIEYVRPNGERVSKPYDDIGAYKAELASRDVMLDPTSPHYREMMEDLDLLYSGRGGARTPGARTSMGLDWEGQLDAVAGKPAREELATAFAANPARLEALVGELGAVEVMRLSRNLGPAGLANAAGRLGGETIRNLAFNLTPAEVAALVAAHDPVHLAWAARNQSGQAAREVLVLPRDVLAALSDPAGGIPSLIVRRLMRDPVLVARLPAVVAAVPAADLALLRQRLGNEGFIQVMTTENRPDALREMGVRLRAGENVELRTPVALGSAAAVLDSNLLIPLQRLRAGVPWRGPAPPGPPGSKPIPELHDGDRRRVTELARRFGVTFADPAGVPTPAEIEALVARIRNHAPNIVLAETPEVPGTSRGQAMIVDRSSADYQLALREMSTGTTNQQVGRQEGGADRSAIADTLFAEREPGGKPPVFYTDDARVARPLMERWGDAATITPIGANATRADPGDWATRFARHNPNGFEVVIRGRRIRVILMR